MTTAYCPTLTGQMVFLLCKIHISIQTQEEIKYKSSRVLTNLDILLKRHTKQCKLVTVYPYNFLIGMCAVPIFRQRNYPFTAKIPIFPLLLTGNTQATSVLSMAKSLGQHLEVLSSKTQLTVFQQPSDPFLAIVLH